jgi:periplasmic protein TonB
LPIALLAGAIVTLLMYWVMWSLISRPIDAEGMREATRIEFTRMRKDSDVASKREEKIERERPPPTPEVPKMAFNTGAVENNVATLNPTVNARDAMSGLNLSAGSDRDTIPLVRVPPEYPVRAQNRGLEGWVIVQFTITGTGSVKDAKVVKSSNSVFEEAALKSISRWRYNPKVENGVAVERVGVQTQISFKLES